MEKGLVILSLVLVLSLSLVSATYQCPGEVRNALCYNNLGSEDEVETIFDYGAFDEIKIHPPFENERFKITFDYSLKTKVNEEFELNIEIENKKDENLDFLYDYFVSDESYLVINELNDFSGAVSDGKNKKVTIPTNDKKLMIVKIKPTENNVLREKFFFFYVGSLDEQFILEKIIGPSEGVNCGGRLFPEKMPVTNSEGISSGYNGYKCCDDVFYPEFECCSDSDCKGRCIDGKCISKMSNSIDLAIGDKKGLIVVLSDETSSDKCEDKSDNEDFNGINIKKILDLNERYWDKLADLYLDEDKNFINFEWAVIGNFNLGFNLENEQDNYKIVQRLASECQLDIENFDEIILTGNNIGKGVRGYAGRPIVMDILEQPSFTHEIGHNFGASDLYNTGSGHLYQWGDSVYSGGHNPILMDQYKLPIARAEIGWVDLDDDGIPEIKETNLNKSPKKSLFARIINFFKRLFYQ